jgi:apolipoprotein N-acyltransferase
MSASPKPLLLASLALVGGGIAPLALAPLNWWPLALLSVALFFWCLEQVKTSRQSFVVGFAYGAGYFTTGVSWVYVSMVDHGSTAIPLALVLTAIFCLGLGLFYTLFAWLYQRFLSNLNNWLKIIAFAALWVLLDILRGWLLTGFPWLYLGYGGLSTWLAGYAPVIGQHGITWLLVVTALTVFMAWRRPIYLMAPLVIWLSGLGLQQIDWTEPAGERQVALLQGNIDLQSKWLPEQLGPTLEYYFGQTYAHLDSDVIIWPETAIATYWDNVLQATQALSEIAAQQNTLIISGTVLRDQNDITSDYYNGLVAFGQEQGAYAKQQLVPFGEYVPLQNWLRGLIQFFDLPMSGFRPAPVEQGLLTQQSTAIAGNICYEIAYSGLVAMQAANAQLIVTVSNDTWFGNTWAPWQHLQMAQMRALENGRPVARGTNSGVSALIDHQGNIVVQAPQFEIAELVGQLQLRQGRTPFNYLATIGQPRPNQAE